MPNYPIEHRKALGEYVRQMRAERGYADLEEWKAAVGRSDRYLLGLERGEPAGPKTIKAVAQALGVEDGELFRILNSGAAPEPGGWGTVGPLEDHAAALGAGNVDLNVMFSQAVRFAATVGILVPQVRDEAEKVTVALSDLFQHGLEKWDRKPLDERTDLFGPEDEVDLILADTPDGGDGNADNTAGGPASTSKDNYELIAHEEQHTIESEQGHDETP